jgi:hypothetical protein
MVGGGDRDHAIDRRTALQRRQRYPGACRLAGKQDAAIAELAGFGYRSGERGGIARPVVDPLAIEAIKDKGRSRDA